jgi:DNA-binding NtrC family response regulator
VTRAITACAGNISRAAELLGVSRPTLYDLISRHDLAATAVRETIVADSAGGVA